MFSRPQRPEYPKDFEKLYGWLEDKVFNLYEAIRLKKTLHVRDVSADIIVTACELVEYAEEVTDIAGGGKEAPGWRVRS
jgi:hypothetical protein